MSLARPIRPTLLVGLILLLAGCSNSPHPAEWNASDTYFVVTAAEPVSFDPGNSYNAGDAPIMDLIYPQYFRYNYLKEAPWGFQLNLGLVEPNREPLDGTDGGKPFHGEKWTFELRHDIRFQDDPCFAGGKGRAVTAHDIEYSFKRLCDPKTAFPLDGNLADKVLGWKAYKKDFGSYGGGNYDRPLPGFRVDPGNPYRFSILLTTKYPQLRYIMAMHFTTPVPREAVEKYKDSFSLFHPVGCGTFKMQEYIPHDHIVLIRNPNNNLEKYPNQGGPATNPELLADADKPLPLTNRIDIDIILEPVTVYNLFDQGYLDSWGIGQTNAQFMLRAMRPGERMIKRGITLKEGVVPFFEYCGFNMSDPTFGGYTPEKRKLRQAISLTIDSDAYIDLLYQGLAKKSEFLLPRGLGGYDPNYVNPYRVYDPTLKRAKELLAEAGYRNGIDPKTGSKLVLTLDNFLESPIDRLRGRVLVKQIERIGIKVATVDETYATYNDKVKTGKIQFYDWGWVADYPDAEDFLMLLYGPNSPDPNNDQYKNKEYDKLFEQVRGMDDGPKRAALIHKMRDIAVEDCPYIYIDEPESHDVYQPWIRNGVCNPIVSDLYKYRAVRPHERVQLQQRWNRQLVVPFVAFFGVLVLGSIPAWRTVRRQRNRRSLRPAPKEEHR